MRKDKGKTNFLIKVVIYILIFILLIFLGTGIGFMVGGGNFFQAFNWSTWQHLIDYFKR